MKKSCCSFGYIIKKREKKLQNLNNDIGESEMIYPPRAEIKKNRKEVAKFK